MSIHVTTGFESADRYRYDFNKCSASKGWVQVDTKQDASYYGTWANPFTRQLCNYCEGDVTITNCDTDDDFVQAVNAMVNWNKEAGYWLGIDPGWPGSETCVKAIARFAELGLQGLLH